MALIAMLEAAEAATQCLHWLESASYMMAEHWNQLPGLWSWMPDDVVPRIGTWPSLA